MELGTRWEHSGGCGGIMGTLGWLWGHCGDIRALGLLINRVGDTVGTLGWLWGHRGDTGMPLGALWGHQSSVCAHEWVGDTVGTLGWLWGHHGDIKALGLLTDELGTRWGHTGGCGDTMGTSVWGHGGDTRVALGTWWGHLDAFGGAMGSSELSVRS